MLVARQEPVAPSQPQHRHSRQASETEMGNCFASRVSLDSPCNHRVNCAFRSEDHNRKAILIYSPPSGATKYNFGFVPSGNGYQARFRSEVGDDIYGHDSPTIPSSVYQAFKGVAKGTSGSSYRVTFSTGGQDVSSYFK